MQRYFNNKLYSKIFKNVSTGIGFKNTNVGIVNEVIPKHKKFQYSNDEYSKDMLYCISNISYNLYAHDIGYTYHPMCGIINGWCLQNAEDKKIWTITNRVNVEFDKAEILNYNKNTTDIHKISSIPCIKLDKVLEYNEIKYLEKDFIDEYEYEYRKLFPISASF